ncbi:TBC1 domain family member 5 [Candida viswanathii]|uniref:Oxidant-induced cell-cycle arrest protein 5 n=1 Tax=Candida viswanathii TaxID=5486 RepID=A0A367YAV8_9ASCO|nr:TBC1 domain family member 5 [Candida viswanathii]
MLKENEIISRTLLTIDKFKGSVGTFKAAITAGEYTSLNMPNCFTRSLIWKVCLITESINLTTINQKLRDSRVVYHQLMHNKDMKISWSGLDPESAYYQPSNSVSRKASSKHKGTGKGMKNTLDRVHILHDPLSEENGSKVDETHDDNELLVAIILDVDRLLPGEAFYQNFPNKKQLVEILYIWAKCNPQVGYKQGLHEIIGLIFMHLSSESVIIPQTNTFSNDDLKILDLYDINYLSHDVFTIFNKFMIQSGIITNFYESEQSLWNSIERFNMYLMKIDQFIHYTLNTKLKLEAQLWIIRYLRLLLSRELGEDVETTMLLWDKLIASQLSSDHLGSNLTAIPELLIFIIIQLLMQKKSEIIASDFSECLSLLLHYPVNFTSQEARNEFIRKLYKDATKMYERRDNDLKLYEYGVKLNKEKMKFEKTRLEMRLKKKVQLMLNTQK